MKGRRGGCVTWIQTLILWRRRKHPCRCFVTHLKCTTLHQLHRTVNYIFLMKGDRIVVLVMIALPGLVSRGHGWLNKNTQIHSECCCLPRESHHVCITGKGVQQRAETVLYKVSWGQGGTKAVNIELTHL